MPSLLQTIKLRIGPNRIRTEVYFSFILEPSKRPPLYVGVDLGYLVRDTIPPKNEKEHQREVMLKKMIICLTSLAVAISLYSIPAYAASVPEAKPDQGLVVFYRSKSFGGAAIPFHITESGGVSTGTLTNGSMFYKYYEPGQKTFDVSTLSIAGSDLITLDIVAGETYFLRGRILLGWPAGRPSFSQEQEAKALQDVGKL